MKKFINRSIWVSMVFLTFYCLVNANGPNEQFKSMKTFKEQETSKVFIPKLKISIKLKPYRYGGTSNDGTQACNCAYCFGICIYKKKTSQGIAPDWITALATIDKDNNTVRLDYLSDPINKDTVVILDIPVSFTSAMLVGTNLVSLTKLQGTYSCNDITQNIQDESGNNVTSYGHVVLSANIQ